MSTLLDGRDLRAGPESLHEHVARLGPLPKRGRELVDMLVASGLTGRGGAAFPVGLKWRAQLNTRGPLTIVANGAEGEPHSKKDRLLMATRPHLVLDGALLAASALHAREIVIYIGEHHHAARAAMQRAVVERTPQEQAMLRFFAAPARYVAGDSNAAVHAINSGIALPTTEKSSPTLVQNVETLAHIALIARTGRPTGTVLLAIAGSVARPGVLEATTTSTVRDALARAGGISDRARAILIGGYFGAWVDVDTALDLRVDPTLLREKGLTLGCGVVGVLPASRCPVCETAGIMRYLAGESSSQCGPCLFGLRALAETCSRVANHGANAQDLAQLERWSIEVNGRGACKHPDGAVMFLRSALKTFATEFATHSPHSVRQTA